MFQTPFVRSLTRRPHSPAYLLGGPVRNCCDLTLSLIASLLLCFWSFRNFLSFSPPIHLTVRIRGYHVFLSELPPLSLFHQVLCILILSFPPSLLFFPPPRIPFLSSKEFVLAPPPVYPFPPLPSLASSLLVSHFFPRFTFPLNLSRPRSVKKIF